MFRYGIILIMVAIVLTVAAALCLSAVFDKKIHETAPVALFTVTLAVYVFALICPLSVSVFLCIALVAVLLAGVLVYSYRKRHFTIREFISKHFDIYPLAVLITVCVLFCILMSERHVFFYDDLSYWGLYTKNIFYINRLPHLFENCSVDYKDYTPIMQILQYLAMYGRTGFSESVMYQTNVCSIYVMLLPMLSIADNTTDNKHHIVKIVVTVLYVIFPHILTAQFYYRLGVDLFLALVFGYILYYIFVGDDNRMFALCAICPAISYLALIKTSGIVLCLFAIIMFAIKVFRAETGRFNALVKTCIVAMFAFGSYMTWQLFLRYSWNNGYLSNRVKDGITGGTFAFPEYTKEVTANYIHHFFFYPLSRNSIGATAFLIVTVVLVCFGISYAISKREEDKGGVSRDLRALFITSLVCFVIFCIAHIAMYLFVFDEWEAHGLLEFDRYITQYLGGLFYVAMILLIKAALTPGKAVAGLKGNAAMTVLIISVVVFITLLPYADMKTYLIPSNYVSKYDERFAPIVQSAHSEWERSGIANLNLPHDGTSRVTVIADVWDEKTQFLEYESVPQPLDSFINVPAIAEGEIAGFIESHHEQYVYVAENAPGAYAGDWEETGVLTADGNPLRAGTLYREVREKEGRLLEAIK